MKNTPDRKDIDRKLDELLSRKSVQPSADFTARTIARLHKQIEITDETIDELLTSMPVQPRQDFTARTLMQAHKQRKLLTFLRPALAAAASVTISITGLNVADNNTQSAQPIVAQSDMSEIYTLAQNLSAAAPLLDNNAVETFASLSSWAE